MNGNVNSTIFSERNYVFKDRSFEELASAYSSGKIITGLVVYINEEMRLVTVKLGKDIYATMPYEETTIYPLALSKNFESSIPLQILTILNRVILVKITFMNDDEIIVSRKESMLKACNYLKSCSEINGTIIKINKSYVIVDIGCGITGILGFANTSVCQFKDMHEFFKLNEVHKFIIKSYSEDNRFVLSYKDHFPKYDKNNYTPGQIVTCKIQSPVSDNQNGYFVCVTPQVSGIIDKRLFDPDFKYGDHVKATVVKATDKGLRLRFISFYN